MTKSSALLAVPPADTETAIRHFRSKLHLEVDAWDLHRDLLDKVPGVVVIDARKPDSSSPTAPRWAATRAPRRL